VNARPSTPVLVVAASVLAVAWLFAGLVGIVVASVGMVIAWLRGPRWVAAAAFVALLAAAIGTVVVPMGETAGAANSFASDRAFAAEAARVAGLLTLVSIVGFALEERNRAGEPGMSSEE
jgi:hypothetical protein